MGCYALFLGCTSIVLTDRLKVGLLLVWRCWALSCSALLLCQYSPLSV